MTFLETAVLVLTAIVIIQCVGLVLLAKLIADFLKRFRAAGQKAEPVSLRAGEMAPLFREQDQYGRMFELAEQRGGTTLLLFAKNDCPVCHEVVPQIGKLLPYKSLRTVVITRTDGFDLQLPDGVPLLRADEVIDSYFVQMYPTAVLIDENGMVTANESLSNFHHLRSMVEHSVKKAS